MTMFLEVLSFLILTILGWLIMDYLNDFVCCKNYLQKSLIKVASGVAGSSASPILTVILGLVGMASGNTSSNKVTEKSGFVTIQTPKGVFIVPHSDTLAISNLGVKIGKQEFKLYPGIPWSVAPETLGVPVVLKNLDTGVTREVSGSEIPDLETF